MIVDSLRTKHSYRELMSFDELRAIGARRKGNTPYPVWTLNPRNGEPLPRITFLFPIPNVMHVLAEVSVPRFAIGHNARLLNPAENDAAIRAIAENVEIRTGLSFDPLSARVSKVDFATDIQLGEPTAYKAIRSLSRMKLPGLKRQTNEDSTVYFRNKSREIKIYIKLTEVYAKKGCRAAIEAARGNLRFEYSLLNDYGIQSHAQRLGLADSTVRCLITKSVSDTLFDQVFSEIDFPNLIDDRKSNFQKLKDQFGTRKAMRLAGFLNMVLEFGEHFYKDPIHRYSKDSYHYAVRECRKAGVWNSGDFHE